MEEASRKEVGGRKEKEGWRRTEGRWAGTAGARGRPRPRERGTTSGAQWWDERSEGVRPEPAYARTEWEGGKEGG